MKRAGYTLEEIAWVLKHKNLESLCRYLVKPTQGEKENFSNDLFKYTRKASEHYKSDDDDDDFETPPQPPKRITKEKKKEPKNYDSKSCKISDAPTNQLVPIDPNTTKDNVMPSTSNIIQMY